MAGGLEVLTVARINTVMQALQDQRELPQDLVFLKRTKIVPAVDGEIMARFIGRVMIADLVADDSEAVTYSYQKVQLERTAPPNLKVGTNMTQSMLNQLSAISGTGGVPSQMENSLFDEQMRGTIDGLLLGVRQRMEALIIAMHLDNFNYDRLGIKIQGASWGMPSDLNVTPANAWTDVTNATPIADIQLTQLTAQVRYGIKYTRLTMSTTAFRYMIATTEFQTKAKLVLAQLLLGASINLLDIQTNTKVASNILGMDIELYDARYWSQDQNGNVTSTAYLPVTKVIMDSPGNDNNGTVQDFANGVVTETVVNSLMGGNTIGRFTGGSYGPVGYATAKGDMNPPNITFWGVSRGFPRKYMLQANAVLTVGTFSDLIAIGVPF